MKKTLAELLNPDFDHYRSIGELARTLQFLLSTAHSFRDPGRWGSSGPTEVLSNYGGCTNSQNQEWHSDRITCGCGHGHTTTWQQNHDALYDCILSALCGMGRAFERWRKEHDVHLQMALHFPMAYQNQKDEQTAWDGLMGLHKFRLPVPTLNNQHRRVNVLASPELIVHRDGVSLDVKVTDSAELRSSPDCFSCWRVSFLTGKPQPKWNCRKETFAQFILRAVAYYKAVKPNFDSAPLKGK